MYRAAPRLRFFFYQSRSIARKHGQLYGTYSRVDDRPNLRRRLSTGGDDSREFGTRVARVRKPARRYTLARSRIVRPTTCPTGRKTNGNKRRRPSRNRRAARHVRRARARDTTLLTPRSYYALFSVVYPTFANKVPTTKTEIRTIVNRSATPFVPGAYVGTATAQLHSSSITRNTRRRLSNN